MATLEIPDPTPRSRIMTPPRTCRARKGGGFAAGRIELGGFAASPPNPLAPARKGSWPIPRRRQPHWRFAHLLRGRSRFCRGTRKVVPTEPARCSSWSKVDQLGRTGSRFFQAVQRDPATRARHFVPLTSCEFSNRSRVDQLGRTQSGPDLPNLDTYSRAVISVVEAVSPAVIGIHAPRIMKPDRAPRS